MPLDDENEMLFQIYRRNIQRAERRWGLGRGGGARRHDRFARIASHECVYALMQNLRSNVLMSTIETVLQLSPVRSRFPNEIKAALSIFLRKICAVPPHV